MSLGIFAAAFFIMLASLSGGLFLQKTAQIFLEKHLSYLVAFSAGVFLVTAGILTFEVFTVVSQIYIGLLLIFLGYILAHLFEGLMPELHHDHEKTHIKDQTNAWRLIVAGGIHNITDGVVLLTAFTVSTTIGIATMISIFIHEVLQDISKFFVLRESGFGIKKALLVNFSASGTILLGVVIGFFALATKDLLGILLAISAGFFIHVVSHDLFPKRQQYQLPKQYLKHLTSVLIGILLMGLINLFLHDEHEPSAVSPVTEQVAN